MDQQTLETLGITQEELQDRVTEKIVRVVLSCVTADDDGAPYELPTEFRRSLEKHVTEKIDQAIDEIAGKHVFPNFTSCIESLVMQKTNEWGEKKGESCTFKEYLVQRAESYMNEQVDFQGKSKKQSDSWSWRGTQTRLVHLVEHYLHHSIESAMKEALANANSQIAKGIEATVKIKLAEIARSLKVGVQVN